MCEVEFWEVFLSKEQGFLEWFPSLFHLLAAD
jgi:hypothetical protein